MNSYFLNEKTWGLKIFRQNGLFTAVLIFVTFFSNGCFFLLSDGSIDAKRGKPTEALRSSAAVAPLVCIRFPANIGDTAQGCAKDLIVKADAGWKDFYAFTNQQWDPAWEDQRLAQSITKCAYYAVEFYAVLRERLPANTVLLEPETVVRDADGNLRLNCSYTPPPSVLTIDFEVVTEPNYDAFTTGKYITPSISIRTQENRICLLPVLKYARGYPCFFGFYSSHSLGEDYLAELMLESQYGIDGTNAPSHLESSRPAQYSKENQLIVYCSQMTNEQMNKQLNGSEIDPAHSPFAPLLNEFSNYVVELLNSAPESEFRLAEARYQDVLALPGGPHPLLRDFERVEREFLTKQDIQFTDRLYAGKFGDSFRKYRRAEQDALDKNTDASNAQAIATMAALSGSIVSNVSAASGKISEQQNSMNQLVSMSTISQANQSAQNQVLDIQTQFRDYLGRDQEAQSEFILNTVQGQQKIAAKSLDELRAGFRRIAAEENASQKSDTLH